MIHVPYKMLYISDNKEFPKRDALLKSVKEIVYEVADRYFIQDVCDLKIVLADPFNPVIAYADTNNIIFVNPFSSPLLYEDVVSKFEFKLENIKEISKYISNEYDLPIRDSFNTPMKFIFKTVKLIYEDKQLAAEAVRACIAHELAHLVLGHTSHSSTKSEKDFNSKVNTLVTALWCFTYWFTNVYLAFVIYYMFLFMIELGVDYFYSRNKEILADRMAAIHYPRGGVYGFRCLKRACIEMRSIDLLSRFSILPSGEPIYTYLSHGSLESRINRFEKMIK